MSSALPMPVPTNPTRPFSTFKAISLDVYGTLIDYKPAIYSALAPILSRLPTSSSWRGSDESMHTAIGARLLALFKTKEDELTIGKPMRPFSTVLRDIYLAIAEEIGIPSDAEGLENEAEEFGGAVGQLPAYSDSVEACQRIERLGFKLVFLSNIEKKASSLTSHGPLKEVEFWREYSASDFPQDDPDRRKLEFLIDQLSEERIGKEEILHVANSLGHDHAVAKKLGLSSVWIVRDAVRWGKEQEMKDSLGKVGYGWRFDTLADLADAMEVEERKRD